MMKFKGYKIAHMSIGIIFIISSDRIIKELEIIDIEQSKKASRIIFNNSKRRYGKNYRNFKDRRYNIF